MDDRDRGQVAVDLAQRRRAGSFATRDKELNTGRLEWVRPMRQTRFDDRGRGQLGDIEDRALWKEYQAAYSEAIGRTSTKNAPWYIIPSDHKWFRNWAVSRLLIETLTEMDPKYPDPPDLAGITIT